MRSRIKKDKLKRTMPYINKGRSSLAKDLRDDEKPMYRWSRVSKKLPDHANPKTDNKLSMRAGPCEDINGSI